MKKLKCPKCGKVIEGFNKRHCEFMMMQHNLKHRHEDNQKEDNNKK
jgi:hypothetical protein